MLGIFFRDSVSSIFGFGWRQDIFLTMYNVHQGLEFKFGVWVCSLFGLGGRTQCSKSSKLGIFRLDPSSNTNLKVFIAHRIVDPLYLKGYKPTLPLSICFTLGLWLRWKRLYFASSRIRLEIRAKKGLSTGMTIKYYFPLLHCFIIAKAIWRW